MRQFHHGPQRRVLAVRHLRRRDGAQLSAPMSVGDRHLFSNVRFHRFKAFRHFSLDVKRFNVLVDPNNAGKSTILTAFRILAAAIRKASARSAERVRGPHGTVFGYAVDLGSISVAEENIFHDYDQSEPAEIEFKLSNQNSLTLYFPEAGACYLLPDAQGRQIRSPRLRTY
jgi:predicted ATPase